MEPTASELHREPRGEISHPDLIGISAVSRRPELSEASLELPQLLA